MLRDLVPACVNHPSETGCVSGRAFHKQSFEPPRFPTGSMNCYEKRATVRVARFKNHECVLCLVCQGSRSRLLASSPDACEHQSDAADAEEGQRGGFGDDTRRVVDARVVRIRPIHQSNA